jgi:hypothetical protein
MNWKLIEKAPKDGTPILAIRSVKDAEVLSIPITVFWSSFHPNAVGKETWRTSTIGGNKVEGLTHYMLLS